jgi:dinuclear metal center YbgI/SA1388 family protein
VGPLGDLTRYLDDLLDCARFQDYGPNGIQVPGPNPVRKVVTGVSATRAFIEAGIAAGADLLLVHHGLFWGPGAGLDALTAERLRPLFKADVALAAYHLPLDAHPEHGNNALLARALGCEAHHAFLDIGRAGTFAGDGITREALRARVREATGGREPLIQGAGREDIRTIGIISGGAAKHLPDAAGAGLDAFLTGEPREPAMAEADELGIHFVAAGHYATETLGIRRLGDLLAGEFGVEHEFVDLPNPV